MCSLESKVKSLVCDTLIMGTINRTTTVYIVIFLFFIIIVLPYMSKELNYKRDDQMKTALYFQMVFLELTSYDCILKREIDKIVTANFPASV